MVIVEHAAEAPPTYDAAAHGCVVVRCRDEFVVERLMRPLSVIVFDVLLDDLPQVAFAQRNDAGQTLAPDGTDPTFRVRIEIWTSRRQPYTSDTTCREHLSKCMCVQRVAVHDDVAMLEQKAIDRVGQVTSYLKHPGLIRFVHNAGNFHAATRQVDDEQHMNRTKPAHVTASTVKKSSTMSSVRRGRLQPRRAVPSYLRATRRRYQRSKVSGVTNVSSSLSALRPELLGRLGEPTSLGVRITNAPATKLLAQHGISASRYCVTRWLSRVIHPARVSSRNCSGRLGMARS
jgi:hypothetical protein